jgi:hypothetical protein
MVEDGAPEVLGEGIPNDIIPVQVVDTCTGTRAFFNCTFFQLHLGTNLPADVPGSCLIFLNSHKS